VTTLRQQDRDVLDYRTEAYAAAIRGDRPFQENSHPRNVHDRNGLKAFLSYKTGRFIFWKSLRTTHR
jgi:hypothetical protein